MSPSNGHQPPPRILVVDDSEDIRMMLRDMLRNRGWETEEAVSGEQALEQVGRSVGFDLLVLDHRMPGLTGMEVARKLRKDGFGQGIILYSAYLEPRMLEEAESLGVPTVDKTELQSLVGVIQQLIVS